METTTPLKGTELNFLRERLQQKREELGAFRERIPEGDSAREVVRDYLEETNDKPLFAMPSLKASDEARLLAVLAPKSTDEQVKMLAQVASDKGIKEAIRVAQKLDDESVEDDFHRFLVQYLVANPNAKLDVPQNVWKALHMTLYEVVIPDVLSHNDGASRVKEVMRLMEQWYASMQAVSSGKDAKDSYLSIEITLPENSNDVSFFCAIENEAKERFEKTVLALFPEVRVEPKAEDFNIFSHASFVSGAVAAPQVSSALPITTYKDMEGDPIVVLLNTFSKMKKEGEGACIQFLVRPIDEGSTKKFASMLDDLQKGDTWKRVLEKQSTLKEVFHILGTVFDGDKKEDKEKPKTHNDELAMKGVAKKLETSIVPTNLRIITTAESRERADGLRDDFIATFNQYNKQGGGQISFAKKDGNDLKELIHEFEYRLFNERELYLFNLEELATMAHFPLYVKEPGQLRSTRFKSVQAPMDLPTDGVLLGVNQFRQVDTEVKMLAEDRMRHLYVIGQTGTGKTTILKNMIIQDIHNGEGCCFIDPHGSDVEDILANIPESRKKDVIYFDPSYTDRPTGLNMLEYDRNKPEQKTFVINELLSIFRKLFAQSSPESMGPAFEQYFRNTSMLVMEHPESGNTLLDLLRVLSDKDYRDYKLSKCANPLVLQFWKNAEATTGDQGLQNYVQYIANKFDVFLSNDVMRPIIAQEKSTFNIRSIMDEKKIFLVNLSKGRLGDINAQLIGLILVGKFLQAALGRVDTQTRPDFFLYIDEFQNVTTPSISAILSEARKYRLSLTMAHQFIAQLPEDIKGSVFGNVGTKIFYRVGPDDATYLETQLAPTFTKSDLLTIENYHCFVSLLSKNTPQKPFDMAVPPSPKGNREQVEALKQESFLAYGRPRQEVEAEILKKYQ